MSETSGPVEIDLLGRFAVRVAGAPIVDTAWSRRHPSALVKMLALVPHRTLHREQVADRLWPEATLAESGPRLHKAAHYARTALGRPDGIVLRDELVALLPGQSVTIDAVEFERMARQAVQDGSVADAEAALAGYGGPLLPTDLYEEWAAGPRDRLAALHRDLLRCAGRWQDLLAEDPTDETANLEVLRGLVNRGQRSLAMQHYRRMVDVYQQELGVAPPGAHQRLYRRLLTQPDLEPESTPGPGSEPRRPPASAPPAVDERGAGEPQRAGARSLDVSRRSRGRLPALRGRLIGRDNDMRHLEELLSGYRVVTIAGPGGAGKSKLALALAHRRSGPGDQEVVFAELAPARDRGTLVRVVADAAGVQGAASGDVGQLGAHLGSRTMLLVLDNCEHLLDQSAELVDAMLDAGPAAEVLITSREPLRVDGEAVYQLGSLGPEAAALFAERAKAATGRAILPPDAPSVLEVCEHLDGLPLAIELAAAQLPHLTLNELLGRLDDRLGFFVGARPRAGDRHSALAATIGWSYDLLAEPARDLFERLGVFPAHFDFPAVRAVCAAADRATVTALIGDLVAKSLVVHDHTTGRYHLLETVRLFARQRLEQSGRLVEITELLRRHVLDRVMVLPRPRRWISATAAARNRDDIENVRLAFDLSVAAGASADAVDIALGMCSVWRSAASYGEGLQWASELARCDLAQGDRLWLCLIEADLGLGSGDPRLMSTSTARALDIARGVTGEPVAVVIAEMYQALMISDPDRSADELASVAARANQLREPQLERLTRAFRVVARLIGGHRPALDAEIVDLTSEHPDDEWERYICIWAAWVTAVADRDGAALRRWIETQQINIGRSGLRENWLTMFSEALTKIGEGVDYLDQLRAARRRAESEGRRTDADCVLALAYAAACRNDWVSAAQLLGACGNQLFEDTANFVQHRIIRELVVRPALPEPAYEAAMERGRRLDIEDVLARHGL